jgi:hypothetical protein
MPFPQRVDSKRNTCQGMPQNKREGPNKKTGSGFLLQLLAILKRRVLRSLVEVVDAVPARCL